MERKIKRMVFMKYILIIGRWSPFHLGHKYIIDSFVKNNTPVCIAIRESEEIYPSWLREEMIKAVYAEEYKKGLVEIIRIPDINGVAVGRDVGYYLVDVPEDIKRVSGTNIRKGLSTEYPEEVNFLIKQYEEWKEYEKSDYRGNKESNS